jgi:hypothetical protein
MSSCNLRQVISILLDIRVVGRIWILGGAGWPLQLFMSTTYTHWNNYSRLPSLAHVEYLYLTISTFLHRVLCSVKAMCLETELAVHSHSQSVSTPTLCNSMQSQVPLSAHQ